MKEWFASWFGDEYLALYPHRDAAEARSAVALIHGQLDGVAPRRALDLACGAGRHTRVLREIAWTVGLDLSFTLLSIARRESPDAPYVRADMRAIPFADHAFDLVVNLFTSFGYFEADAQHRRVLAEVARVTCPGGRFVMDFLNAGQVRRSLVPYDERAVGDRVVEQRRAITPDGRFVQKTISLRGDSSQFVERVRLFDAAELATMIEEAGFRIDRSFGGYDASAFSAEAERVILFATRE